MTGRKIVALAGGVGGAKLALGLAHVLPAEELTVAVNTADDFEHLGLYICPDLDTVMYTLGGLANPETGWGRRDETWNVLDAFGKVGGETWFRLGDKDLATHIERTRRLRAGEPLSSVIADFARRFGIAPAIVPMCDEPVRTARLDPDHAASERRTIVIARRAILAMLAASGRNDVVRTYFVTQRDKVDYNIAYIGADFTIANSAEFDQTYMRALYEYGYRQAIDGQPWHKAPPGLDRN